MLAPGDIGFRVQGVREVTRFSRNRKYRWENWELREEIENFDAASELFYKRLQIGIGNKNLIRLSELDYKKKETIFRILIFFNYYGNYIFN